MMRSTKYYLAIAFTPPFLIGLIFATILVSHGRSGDRDWLGAAAVVSLVTGFGSVACIPLAAAAMKRDFDRK